MLNRTTSQQWAFLFLCFAHEFAKGGVPNVAAANFVE